MGCVGQERRRRGAIGSPTSTMVVTLPSCRRARGKNVTPKNPVTRRVVPHAGHSPRQRADRSGQSYGGPLRWSDRSAPPDRVGGLVLQPGGVIARGVARGAGFDRMTTGTPSLGGVQRSGRVRRRSLNCRIPACADHVEHEAHRGKGCGDALLHARCSCPVRLPSR